MLLSQVQLLPIVKIAAYRVDLVLEFYGFISEISSFVHLLEVDQLVGIDVELEDFLVKPFCPASSQYVYEFTLSDGGRIRERKEEFG